MKVIWLELLFKKVYLVNLMDLIGVQRGIKLLMLEVSNIKFQVKMNICST